MDTILDYLDWRGDIPFDTDGLNEVDSLIFSTLAYLKLHHNVSSEPGKGLSLRELAPLYKTLKRTDSAFVSDKSSVLLPQLLHRCATVSRYREVLVSGHLSRLDPQADLQFSATVFSIGKTLHYIAFRGTDDSIVGWKEDFQMSFMEAVEAQRTALAYLEEILPKLKGDILLGGHSKGGNLAVYGGTQVDPKLRKRILGIFTNDGPGFLEQVLESEGYRAMEGKIHSLVPKSSVVGMLLSHPEQYRIVNSREVGLLQHDPFSWEVRGNRFVYAQHLSLGSRGLRDALQVWMARQRVEDREAFVSALFDLVQSTGALRLGDINLKSLETMVRVYKDMDEETQGLLKRTVSSILDESRKALGKRIATKIGTIGK